MFKIIIYFHLQTFCQPGQHNWLRAVFAASDRDAQRPAVLVQLDGIHHAVQEQVRILGLGLLHLEGDDVVRRGLQDLERPLNVHVVQLLAVDLQEAVTCMEGARPMGDRAPAYLRYDERLVWPDLRCWNQKIAMK